LQRCLKVLKKLNTKRRKLGAVNAYAQTGSYNLKNENISRLHTMPLETGY